MPLTPEKDMTIIISTLCWVFSAMLLIWTIVFFSSCTISLQNVSTNGKSQDQVDDAQTPSTNIKTDVKIPLSSV